ncbi:hypothetical protein Goari_009140, partial [Gossypium aridum]|nr:hypothetical protein [Gossypium aridum]
MNCQRIQWRKFRRRESRNKTCGIHSGTESLVRFAL